MDCKEVREWLLQGDESRPAELADHLHACAACRSLAGEVTNLEAAWRSLPVPVEAESARVEFLKRLPRPLPAPSRRRVLAVPRFATRWAIAAMLLLAVGLGGWLLLSAPEVQASPTVVERLVDWNVNLTEAPTPADRDRIYAEARTLRGDLEHSDLSLAERELASMLLDNGDWLVKHNDDPLGAAERFSTVADKLVEHLETAANGKDMRAIKQYAKLQKVVAQHGVSANLEKVQATGALNFERQRNLEKIILRDNKRMQQLVELMETHPDLSRKEIRKALDLGPKNPKAKAKASDKDKSSSTTP